MKLELYTTRRQKDRPEQYHASLNNQEYIISLETYLILQVLMEIFGKELVK